MVVDPSCDFCMIPKNMDIRNARCEIKGNRFDCLKCNHKRRKTRRILDYYDLIELPNGRHIPVPIAIKLIGIKNVLKISVSRIKRDEHFYWCDECAKESYEYGDDYYGSFFKCKWHKSESEEENVVKELALKLLVEQGKFKKLKYIETATRTGGYIVVNRKTGSIIYKFIWRGEV